VAVGIVFERSLASIQDAFGLGHHLGVTQVRIMICVNTPFPRPDAHELMSDRMKRIGGKVHEQQWLLIVVGHL
jgi:hypothetical protein